MLEADGEVSSDGLEAAHIQMAIRVEWVDTDAAGHQHFSAPLRWVERVETELFERLGVGDVTSGRTPRVRFQIDYRARLWFRDLVEVHLWVAEVGRSSMTLAFAMERDGRLVAEGSYVVVYVGGVDNGSEPWPQEARRRLTHAGDVTGSPPHSAPVSAPTMPSRTSAHAQQP